MFKNALIFGLLGFVISLGTIYVTTPEKESNSQEFSSLRYEDGINGWISFGNILKENIGEALISKDELFISMFMWKTMEPIRLSNKPEIIITEENQSIFWTNGGGKPGTKYTGWQEKANSKGFLIKDSVSIVKTDITSNNGKAAGYLYLVIQNKPNPKEFSNEGWQYYGHVLASSNTMRGYVDDKNISGIKSYFDRVTKKADILNLTILATDKTVVWDTDNSNIGKKMQEGWIAQEKGRKKEDRFYFSMPVKYQERDLADIHFLIKLPVKKGVSFISNLINKLKNLFKPRYLMISAISFIILFLTVSVLIKPVSAEKMPKGAFAKSGPGLQNKIQQLKEEIEQLETTKANVMEEVAKKQKTQKDLEKEIEALKTKKVTMPTEAELETPATAAKAQTKEEKEKTEEELLFDKLLGTDSKTSAKKKEELELTQRIVAKRREEIALSGKIESRRKELLKLEQDIQKLQNQ
ncbi:hypothetical protein JW879_08980 [candidate division WOR-3 bacterium]|nr:hypothetical protein [candidate division WOR-3 bacterium]